MSDRNLASVLETTSAPTNLPHNSSYRPDIDGLRAVAVLAVVLYHVGLSGFAGGFVGVDIFFVISGFLISEIIIRECDAGVFSYRRFYERRVRRILPALFVMLVAVSAMAYFVLSPSDELEFGKDLASVAVFGSNIRYWHATGYFGRPAADSLLLHTWSLGIEEQFYLTFPVCFVWLLRHHRRAASKIVALIAIGSFALCVSWTELRSPQAAFFLLPTRAWELLLGTFIALRPCQLLNQRIVRNVGSIAAIGGLVCSIALFNSSIRFPGFAAALPALSTAVLLVAGRREPSLGASVLSTRPLVFLGLVSYSLYLWHWPFLTFARYSHNRLETWHIAGIVAVSAACAALSWRCVEVPMRRVNRRGVRYSTVLAFCGGAFVLLAGYCVGDQISSGFRTRYSPRALAYLDASKVRDPDTIRCANVEPSSVLRGGLCQLGSSAAPSSDFLLWGDSHAGALLPVFKALATERGVAGLIATSSGCPPALGIELADASLPRCRPFNDSVFALIREKGFHQVIMSAFWSRYIEGPEANAGYEQLRFLSPSGEMLSDAASKQVFENALERTIAKLTSLGIETYIVADVPTYHGLLHMIANAATHGKDVTELGVSSAAYRAQRRGLDSLFARFGWRDGVKVLDSGDILCALGRCAIVADGRSFYEDDHHLTVDGAMALKPLFAPLFGVNRF